MLQHVQAIKSNKESGASKGRLHPNRGKPTLSLLAVIRDLIPVWTSSSPALASTATKAPPNAPASVPNPGARQTFSAPLANRPALTLPHETPLLSTISALSANLPSN